MCLLDGKAKVPEDDQQIMLKKGREVLLAAGQPLRARKLDTNEVESDPLYRWSKLRGEYASEANVETANNLLMYGGWYGPGWYWDPFWSFWSFLPGDGIMWGPFGWGFFSPSWVRMAPYYGYSLGYCHYAAIAGRGGRAALPAGRYTRASVRGFSGAPRAMGSPRMGGTGMGMRMSGTQMSGFGGGGFHGGFGHRG